MPGAQICCNKNSRVALIFYFFFCTCQQISAREAHPGWFLNSNNETRTFPEYFQDQPIKSVQPSNFAYENSDNTGIVAVDFYDDESATQNPLIYAPNPQFESQLDYSYVDQPKSVSSIINDVDQNQSFDNIGPSWLLQASNETAPEIPLPDYMRHFGTTDCPPGSVVTFVRFLVRAKNGANFNFNPSFGLDPVQCAEFCRRNIDPNGDPNLSQKPCVSFATTIDSGGRQLCAFDAAADAVSAVFEEPVFPNGSENLWFYQQKTCLALKDGANNSCIRRPYSFQVTPQSRLKGSVLKRTKLTSDATGYADCLGSCIEETSFKCQAVNYYSNSRLCEMSRIMKDNSPKNVLITNSTEADYFENTCTDSQLMCPDGELFFIRIAKDYDDNDGNLWQSTNATQQSLETCLASCRSSLDVICRFILYQQETGDCKLLDVLPSQAVILLQSSTPSLEEKLSQRKLLFQSVCVSIRKEEMQVADCSIPYTFLAYQNSRISTPKPFRIISEVPVEDCMAICLRDERCKSINFHRPSMNCALLGYTKNDTSSGLTPDRAFGYYEITCQSLESVLSQEATRGCYFKQKRVGRLLRKQFRIAALALNTAAECKMACVGGAAGGNCTMISFSESLLTCYLSNADPSTAPFNLLTEANFEFNTHLKAHCVKSGVALKPMEVVARDSKSVDYLSNIDQIQRSLLSDYDYSNISCIYEVYRGRSIESGSQKDSFNTNSLATCQIRCQNMRHYECRSLSFSASRSVCVLSDKSPAATALANLSRLSSDFDLYVRESCVPAAALRPPQGTTDPTGTREGAIFLNRMQTINFSPPKRQVPIHILPPETPSLGSLSSNGYGNPPPVLAFDQEKTVHTLPVLTASDIQIQAVCSSDGANVTVKSKKPYTGAIYAAERFSVCRNLVTTQSLFWLYLPRPSINTACNTIVTNNVLTAVIVISFDNVVPYDVTTKDDLFYQITCDYNLAAEGGNVLVTSGIVVGGPTPRVVTPSLPPSAYEFALRILRNGQPVQNVLIGEALSFSLESTADPSRISVVFCNVSRVGGSGPVPGPLTIIENGCPLVTQVIGPLYKTDHGLQASLTAFRIDGSAEVQFACLVQVCPQQCPALSCNATNEGALFRKTRDTSNNATTLRPQHRRRHGSDNDTVLESVAETLKVFVDGEDGAPNKKIFTQEDNSAAASCVPEAVFIASVASLALLLCGSCATLACLLWKKCWLTNLPHTSACRSHWDFETDNAILKSSAPRMSNMENTNRKRYSSTGSIFQGNSSVYNPKVVGTYHEA